jgi:hypothetical protein
VTAVRGPQERAGGDRADALVTSATRLARLRPTQGVSHRRLVGRHGWHHRAFRCCAALGAAAPGAEAGHARRGVQIFLTAPAKEQFFLNPKEEDADPYESSQFTVLIANRHGLFGVYSYREVFEFERFWAIGSGRSFALGAMYAGYDKLKTAREIASLGVAAGNEFDKNSAAPVRLHTIKLKE